MDLFHGLKDILKVMLEGWGGRHHQRVGSGKATRVDILPPPHNKVCVTLGKVCREGKAVDARPTPPSGRLRLRPKERLKVERWRHEERLRGGGMLEVKASGD